MLMLVKIAVLVGVVGCEMIVTQIASGGAGGIRVIKVTIHISIVIFREHRMGSVVIVVGRRSVG